jgi:hypothetical protein
VDTHLALSAFVLFFTHIHALSENADLPPPMHEYCVKTRITGQNLYAVSGKSSFPGQGVKSNAFVVRGYAKRALPEHIL